MSFEWWMFHTVGDGQCDACAVEPTLCDCEGLVHTHFEDSLESIEGRCDLCQRVDVPEPVAVE